jgi:hypothetical protein
MYLLCLDGIVAFCLRRSLAESVYMAETTTCFSDSQSQATRNTHTCDCRYIFLVMDPRMNTRANQTRTGLLSQRSSLYSHIYALV